MLLHHSRMTKNPTKLVFEFGGNALGEGAVLLRARRLPQTRLEPRAFVLDRAPLDSLEDGVERHANEGMLAARLDAASCSSDRIKAERNLGAVLADIRRAAPSPEAEFEESRLAVSDGHPADAGNMSHGAGPHPDRKLNGFCRPAGGGGEAGAGA